MSDNNWIVSQRKRLGMSQEELVKRLSDAGMSKTRPTISLWEQTGTLPPSIVGDAESVRILAEVFDLTPEDILKLSGYRLGTGVSPRTRELLDVLEQCPPSQYDRFIEMALEWLRLTAPYFSSDEGEVD